MSNPSSSRVIISEIKRKPLKRTLPLRNIFRFKKNGQISPVLSRTIILYFPMETFFILLIIKISKSLCQKFNSDV